MFTAQYTEPVVLWAQPQRFLHDTVGLTWTALGADPVVVELARPLSGESDEARELARNGEMIYSVTFRLDDLTAGVGHLRACGVEPARRRDGSLVIAPAQALGAVFAVTGEDVPDDPRA